jgi:hypothetical protein
MKGGLSSSDQENIRRAQKQLKIGEGNINQPERAILETLPDFSRKKGNASSIWV